jgi:hypothetical protein
MIRRACVDVLYCDACEAKWSYSGATHDICDDRAKRDGWIIEHAHPLGIPTIRHVCQTCARARQ